MKTIQFPITVTNITLPKKYMSDTNFMGSTCGDFVSIRPCAEEHKDKTYLGIFMGDLPIGSGATLNKDGELEFYLTDNPAVYVPDLKKIIFGCESWWGKIKTAEDLRSITDADINDTWYVVREGTQRDQRHPQALSWLR